MRTGRELGLCEACAALELLCVGEREYACVLRRCDWKVSLIVGAAESGKDEDEIGGWGIESTYL